MLVTLVKYREGSLHPMWWLVTEHAPGTGHYITGGSQRWDQVSAPDFLAAQKHTSIL
jgi:hypothetical protein